MPKVKSIKVGAKGKESLALVIPVEIRNELNIEHGEIFQVESIENKIIYEREAPYGSVWACIPLKDIEA